SDGGGETATGGDYLEIIGVTSRDEFAAEMATETFQSLVRQFSEFAEVTATVHLDRLGTGYHSMQEWGK
ncbi:hypothetical protein K4G86_24450, partial [Mycobacterium tuberculosis]|nr:hypothetical protein [Mycobacterium tuberculosis]